MAKYLLVAHQTAQSPQLLAAAQELIREDKAEFIPEAISEGAFFDMQTMTAALIRLVVDREVEEEIAAAAAPNRHDFTIALERAQKEAVVERGKAAEAASKPAEPEMPSVVLASDELRLT